MLAVSGEAGAQVRGGWGCGGSGAFTAVWVRGSRRRPGSQRGPAASSLLYGEEERGYRRHAAPGALCGEALFAGSLPRAIPRKERPRRAWPACPSLELRFKLV